MKRIRILLNVHQSIMSGALCQLLSGQPDIEVVGEADTSEIGLALAAYEQPDIHLLDLVVDEQVLDTIPILLAAAPGSRVVVLTARLNREIHRRAIRQGALGLVRKEQPFEILLQAIRQVHAGGVWMEGALLTSILKEMPLPGQEKNQTSAEVAMIATLTPREHEILALIGEGFSNKQIALHLTLSERTVHRHLSSIFEKLEVRDRLGLSIFGHRTGLLKTSRAVFK